MNQPNDITAARVQEWARAVGFDAAGVAPVSLPAHESRLRAWLEAGYHGSMEWLARNADVRVDLRARFPWAKSAVVVLRSYRLEESLGQREHKDSGTSVEDRRDGEPFLEVYPREISIDRFVSTYARGDDYHEVLIERLESLASKLREAGGELRSHAYVDTGPVLERQLAAEAGLGWLANNTLLLHPEFGSRFFLGVLVTDLELQPTPSRVGSCGSCRACQPACPTGAFVSPGVLDASRCISYLTIEHRGPIPRELRPAMGQWLFGCDLCQTCCPFEIGATAKGDAAFAVRPELAELTLPALLQLDDEQFRARFRRTPLWRPRRRGLLRNALIVAGNGEHFDALEAVQKLLVDEEPLLREAASWALARLCAVDPARADRSRRVTALRLAFDRETEPWVRNGMAEDLEAMGV